MGSARLNALSAFAGILLCAVGCAQAAEVAAPNSVQGAPTAIDTSVGRPGDASIPFADHGGIYDWHADGTRGIWVQGANRNWFYGTFMSSCTGLDRTGAVGFVTSPSGDLDHWSYVVIRGTVPCHFASFTTSEAPPGRG